LTEPTGDRRGGPPCGRLNRAAALAEVVIVFAATHVAYRAVKRFTALGEWEAAAGTNFIPGAVMAAVTVLTLLAGRRSFEAYGLGLRRWPHDLNVGLACGMGIIALGAVGLAITGFRFDPSRPPDPNGPPQLMRMVGGPALGLLALVALLAVFRGRWGIRHAPPILSVALLVALLAVPPLLAAFLRRPPVWPAVLWNFFCAGFGEELFFRGYVQSRVDPAFGRPWRVLGCNVGPGILVSSLLFGLIHALNTVDYFSGRWDFGWWYGLQNVFEGLVYGYLRARTGSVWAGAVAHGLQDTYVMVPNLLRGE
jgi:membrane protease YdiL (CAAX protease family)